jgi:hypothetical protein
MNNEVISSNDVSLKGRQIEIAFKKMQSANTIKTLNNNSKKCIREILP